MTNDLEQLVRSSLQQRADDVEPTPQLWEQVQRKVARRRALPLLVWTAAGVAAVVTAVAVVPGLVDDPREGVDIQPVGSPSAVDASPSEAAVGPAATAPLTHYVAVVDGRLVLRGLDGSEEVLIDFEEGGFEEGGAVRTIAVRPGSTPDRLSVAAIMSVEGMLDLAVVTRTPAETSSTQTFVGLDTDEASAMPVPAWSPDGTAVATVVVTDGQPELVLVDVDGATPDARLPQQRISLGDVDRATEWRLQDWVASRAEHVLRFTADGRLFELDLLREDGWSRGAFREESTDAYVVDIATGEDGTQYRLLAGGGASQDAEDAGMRLEFGNEVVPLSDLATADPSGAWMTAVEGGAFVGLGDQARLVQRDREGNSPVAPLSGVSYAAWVPVGDPDAGDVPKGPPPAVTEAPQADGPLSASGVTPYVMIDDEGRVAVVTGDGTTREVIVGPELWSPEAAVSVMDVSVRPGSTADDIAGVALLATEGGPELAWFHWNNGATAVVRMEGATGLGAGDTEQRDAPVWSPDGRHIAWVEPSGDGGWTLRTLGMADNGPTEDDAGMGLDVPGQWLRVADWTWEEVDEAAGTARGEILLVGSGAGRYVVPIERQGDGALATSETVVLTSDVEDAALMDAGVRDGEMVSLWIVEGEVRVRQDATGADAVVPLEVDHPLDLDLDVLQDVVVVTRRSTGEAFVVDRAGGVASLEADAATTHGFDPVR